MLYGLHESEADHILKSDRYRKKFEKLKIHSEDYGLNYNFGIRPVVTSKASVSLPIVIIVPFRDNLEITLDCLIALKASDTARELIIITVDNGSSMHESLDSIKTMSSYYIRADVPYNYSYLNNLGHKLCEKVMSGKDYYLLLLNNDCIVDPGCVENLATTMEISTTISAVGANLRYPNSLIQHIGVYIDRNKELIKPHKFLHLYAGHAQEDTIPANFISYAFGCTAACLLINPKHLKENMLFHDSIVPSSHSDTFLLLTHLKGDIAFLHHMQLLYIMRASQEKQLIQTTLSQSFHLNQYR